MGRRGWVIQAQKHRVDIMHNVQYMIGPWPNTSVSSNN